MINEILLNAPLYLLAATRCFTMLLTLPLFSMRTVPRVAKVALAGFMAFLVFPTAYGQQWQYDEYKVARDIFSGAFSLEYIALLVGEGLIGVILGFFVSIIFAAFSSAGQFFSFQMGFSAAEAYDALSQVENPLMGQYLNLVAMLVFLTNNGFQKLFLSGLFSSFDSINAFSLVYCRGDFMTFLLKGLSSLFLNGMVIAFPIVGTLLLISITMGLLSKAAPQMNLLSEGLPITIIVSFIILYFLLPTMIDLFGVLFDDSFESIKNLFLTVKQSKPGGIK